MNQLAPCFASAVAPRAMAVASTNRLLQSDGYTAGELHGQLQANEFDQRGGMARVGVEGSQQERAVNSELFGRRASARACCLLSPTVDRGRACARRSAGLLAVHIRLC